MSNRSDGENAYKHVKTSREHLKEAHSWTPTKDKEGHQKIKEAIESTKKVEKHFEKVLGKNR